VRCQACRRGRVVAFYPTPLISDSTAKDTKGAMFHVRNKIGVSDMFQHRINRAASSTQRSNARKGCKSEVVLEHNR